MLIQTLSPDNYQHVPWKNGGGVTTTIASEKRQGVEGWAGILWQLGRTKIVTPAPFSDLTGFERLQVVIGGSGLVLETPEGEINLREAFLPVRYDGGTPITSRLENGPVEVVNLIASRDFCAIDLIVLRKGEKVLLPAARHILLAPEAPAGIGIDGQEHPLAMNHALAFEGAAQVYLHHGVILVASIKPR
ncbi:MAG: hypothetical protein CFE31_02240 [Rhizobiales bacterium PAR1]|nr:MAG: hypothetical protein CFE31_02240 [Rhizobiales bacterium PAR1]